jgi:hypothetical protein
VSAAEIEATVAGQVRALLRQPQVVIGTWLAAWAEAPDLTECEVCEALHRLEPLWDELFSAEQARIVRLLVERVEVGPAGADIRLRVAGLASLVRDVGAGGQTRRWRRSARPPERGGPHHGPGAADHDPALVKALARAFRYQRLLDEGRYASISEMAAAERIERGYLGSLLRLTLLAPDIVEAILDGRQPPDLALPAVLKQFPADWERQRSSMPETSDGASSTARYRRDLT